jgi:hypothetical protein
MRPLQDVEQLPADSNNESLDDLIALEIEELNEEAEGEQEEEAKKKRMKPHVIRRNVEDYLEQRALERQLRDVFDIDYLFDDLSSNSR